MNPSNLFNETAAAIAISLGLTVSGSELVAGACMAIGGALIAVRFRPTRRTKSYWHTVLGGLFIAIIAAQVAQSAHVPAIIHDIHVSAVMGLSGFASSYALRTLTNLGKRAETHLPKKILPQNEDN